MHVIPWGRRLLRLHLLYDGSMRGIGFRPRSAVRDLRSLVGVVCKGGAPRDAESCRNLTTQRLSTEHVQTELLGQRRDRTTTRHHKGDSRRCSLRVAAVGSSLERLGFA